MLRNFILLMGMSVMLLGLTHAFAWNCPVCDNEMDSKYCTECGTRKPDNICLSCNTDFGEMSLNFCTECGAKMKDSSDSIDTVVTNDEIVLESNPAFAFIDHKLFTIFWHDGVYRCGSDFEPGDYYVMSLYGAGALYDKENTPSNFSWSDHQVFRKVHVETGQYVKVARNAIMVPENEIDENEWPRYGVLLVGRDIPSGEYKVERLIDEYNTELNRIQGISGAYQICNISPDSDPISCSPLWDKQTYITLIEGQYLIINNVQLTLIE